MPFHHTFFGNLQPSYQWIENTKSFRFDGIDDNIQITSNSAIHPTNQFSISLWLKVHSFDTHAVFFSKWDTGIESYDFFVLTTGAVYLTVAGAGGKDVDKVQRSTAAGAVTLDTWYHLVATYNKDGGTDDHIHIYVDGVVDDSVSESVIGTPGILETASDLTIGTRSNGTYYSNASVDEPGFWQNTELTSDEVTELYNSGVPIDLKLDVGDYISAGNLTAYWRMGDDPADDATAGTGTIRDQVGSSHGVPQNTAGDNIVEDTPQ